MNSFDQQRTKAELQDEARKRGLPTSGTKSELIDRLRDGVESRGTVESRETVETPQTNQSSEENAEGRQRRSARPPAELARIAERHLVDLTGSLSNGVSGFSRDEEGWRVTVEIVEFARIPPATDILSSYDVVVDDDGELVAYERRRRYMRGHAREE